MFDSLEFPADDQLRQPVEEGTIVNARARRNEEGEVDIRQGKSDYGPWISIPMVVVGGEHDGRYASHIVTVNPSSPKFREMFEVITGIDVSKGAKIDKDQFKVALTEGTFELEVGPSKKNPSYTEVKRFVRKVDGVAAPASPATEAAPAASTTDDDDIPF